MSDVILIAVAPQFTASIIETLGDIDDKIIIDAMNSIRTKPEGFNNSFEAIRKLKPNAALV